MFIHSLTTKGLLPLLGLAVVWFGSATARVGGNATNISLTTAQDFLTLQSPVDRGIQEMQQSLDVMRGAALSLETLDVSSLPPGVQPMVDILAKKIVEAEGLIKDAMGFMEEAALHGSSGGEESWSLAQDGSFETRSTKHEKSSGKRSQKDPWKSVRMTPKMRQHKALHDALFNGDMDFVSKKVAALHNKMYSFNGRGAHGRRMQEADSVEDTKWKRCKRMAGCAGELTLYDLVAFIYQDDIKKESGELDNSVGVIDGDALLEKASRIKTLTGQILNSADQSKCDELLQEFHHNVEQDGYAVYHEATADDVCRAKGTGISIPLESIRDRIGLKVAGILFHDLLDCAGVLTANELGGGEAPQEIDDLVSDFFYDSNSETLRVPTGVGAVDDQGRPIYTNGGINVQDFYSFTPGSIFKGLSIIDGEQDGAPLIGKNPDKDVEGKAGLALGWQLENPTKHGDGDATGNVKDQKLEVSEFAKEATKVFYHLFKKRVYTSSKLRTFDNPSYPQFTADCKNENFNDGTKCARDPGDGEYCCRLELMRHSSGHRSMFLYKHPKDLKPWSDWSAEKTKVHFRVDSVFGFADYDKTSTLLFGSKVNPGLICSLAELKENKDISPFTEPGELHKTPYPGYCCMDRADDREGSFVDSETKWATKFSCSEGKRTNGCKHLAPGHAGISEEACNIFSGTWCPNDRSCEELRKCIYDEKKEQEKDECDCINEETGEKTGVENFDCTQDATECPPGSVKTTRKHNPAYFEYLDEAPLMKDDVDETKDHAKCGMLREYFEFDADHPNDAEICDEVKLAKSRGSFEFINQVMSKQEKAHWSPPDPGPDARPEIRLEKPKEPDWTDERAVAWRTRNRALVTTSKGLTVLFEGIQAFKCTTDPLFGSGCALAMNVLCAAALVAAGVVEIAADLTQWKYDEAVDWNEYQKIKLVNEVEVIYGNMEKILAAVTGDEFRPFDPNKPDGGRRLQDGTSSGPKFTLKDIFNNIGVGVVDTEKPSLAKDTKDIKLSTGETSDLPSSSLAGGVKATLARIDDTLGRIGDTSATGLTKSLAAHAKSMDTRMGKFNSHFDNAAAGLESIWEKTDETSSSVEGALGTDGNKYAKYAACNGRNDDDKGAGGVDHDTYRDNCHEDHFRPWLVVSNTIKSFREKVLFVHGGYGEVFVKVVDGEVFKDQRDAEMFLKQHVHAEDDCAAEVDIAFVHHGPSPSGCSIHVQVRAVQWPDDVTEGGCRLYGAPTSDVWFELFVYKDPPKVSCGFGGFPTSVKHLFLPNSGGTFEDVGLKYEWSNTACWKYGDKNEGRLKISVTSNQFENRDMAVFAKTIGHDHGNDQVQAFVRAAACDDTKEEFCVSGDGAVGDQLVPRLYEFSFEWVYPSFKVPSNATGKDTCTVIVPHPAWSDTGRSLQDISAIAVFDEFGCPQPSIAVPVPPPPAEMPGVDGSTAMPMGWDDDGAMPMGWDDDYWQNFNATAPTHEPTPLPPTHSPSSAPTKAPSSAPSEAPTTTSKREVEEWVAELSSDQKQLFCMSRKSAVRYDLGQSMDIEMRFRPTHGHVQREN